MDINIACVIPAHNEEKFISDVILNIPDFVSQIIVINDASTDKTKEMVQKINDPRITLINHQTNMGVGGAVVSGYKKAIESDADIIVKVDGDGQMDLSKITKLIAPIINGKADYAKGVRFRSTEVLRKMPLCRLIGNLCLSFLTKVASGYWHIFDPTNGYTAISRTALQCLSLDRLKKGYLFETDMLVNLYKINAVVMDIEMEAKYGNEISGLSLTHSLFTFPFFLFNAFLKRLLWRYFIYDFSAVSLFILSGATLSGFGFLFGIYEWVKSYMVGSLTGTGTIMVAAVPFLLGFQLLLQALVLDINNVPQTPLQNKV